MKTSAAPAAARAEAPVPSVIVIVSPPLLVRALLPAIASALAEPPFGVTTPVHDGDAASVQIATGASPLSPAVNERVAESEVIAVAVVALSTICDGMTPIVVSSTSPSRAVSAVTELYDDATLAAPSVLETAVAVNAVIIPGFSPSSLLVLQLNSITLWFVPLFAPVNVIVIVSAAIVTDVVTALVNAIELPDCVKAQPDRVAGVESHNDATVLVTVTDVGATAVVGSGVHAILTLAGLVPSVPAATICVAEMRSAPCCGPDVV